MLSHVFHGDYMPNGQATFQPANIYPQFSDGVTVGGGVQPSHVGGSRMNLSQPAGPIKDNKSFQNQWLSASASATQRHYNYGAGSNSREMRNKAEKQRRDRLNSFINELSKLVPLVAKSSKRLDKTSILRLSATQLRIYQILAKSKGTPQMHLPPYVDQILLDQLVCDEMGGFMLIVTPGGKIIFVSHTVETLLGHSQTDLMGQSLFTVTAEEDHDKLRLYLGSEGEMEQGWKKYFNIRIKRAGTRTETPHYEAVRLMGVHRQMSPPEASTSGTNGNCSPTSSTSSVASTSTMQTSINTDILVFFVKLYRPQPLVDKLIAASKDEYITRHLIDGKIIGCDQRIALIAGYMTDEVQGHSAFQYMHKEDVRFVMIALRQMYDRGESKGNSCYRLKSRNGLFIYLRTFGFLEIDSQGIVESFVCVNVQVEEKEGKHHIEEMKRRYSAMFTSSLSSLPYDETCCGSMDSPPWPVPALRAAKMDLTEDPQTIEEAVIELMQNLPSSADESESVQSPVLVEVAESTPDLSGSKVPESTITRPILRVKPGGKRVAPQSPESGKRPRLPSVDSDSSQLSPYSQPLPKIPKLEKSYSPPPNLMMGQQHHRAA